MQGASYFDDSDNDICLQDWFHSSAGTLDNDPRDSRDTVSPASGQDPNLMSSACISELLTDGTERVDRGVQTCAEIGKCLCLLNSLNVLNAHQHFWFSFLLHFNPQIPCFCVDLVTSKFASTVFSKLPKK